MSLSVAIVNLMAIPPRKTSAAATMPIRLNPLINLAPAVRGTGGSVIGARLSAAGRHSTKPWKKSPRAKDRHGKPEMAAVVWTTILQRFENG
jgi:hypothetical protein